MQIASIQITEQQKQQYRDEGYMILERVIPAEHLALLRDECGGQIDRMHARMDEAGTDVIGINHRDRRYFVANCYKEIPILRDFLFSELMAEICRATLGPDAYLFHEQYVVKGKQEGMKFSWHQDSGYVGYPDHKPYLTCWCALDDMSEENGTVHVLPFSQSGIRSWVQHILEEGSNDKVGYFGDAPGITATVPAGSIVVFTSISFHCSGANTTDALRRAYLGQYSAEPLMNREGTALWGTAIPFVRDNAIVVGEPEPDMPHRSDLVEKK
ncbi:MAG: phytanoyl-CoA dioxygenase family protein [Candidatus Latescibacterota bacterium]|nr:phytanoyl-CoA dioxygenase family protein [Candidatus Latescibacterota bacterium]